MENVSKTVSTPVTLSSDYTKPTVSTKEYEILNRIAPVKNLSQKTTSETRGTKTYSNSINTDVESENQIKTVDSLQ